MKNSTTWLKCRVVDVFEKLLLLCKTDGNFNQALNKGHFWPFSSISIWLKYLLFSEPERGVKCSQFWALTSLVSQLEVDQILVLKLKFSKPFFSFRSRDESLRFCERLMIYRHLLVQFTEFQPQLFSLFLRKLAFLTEICISIL